MRLCKALSWSNFNEFLPLPVFGCLQPLLIRCRSAEDVATGGMISSDFLTSAGIV